ncbi:MAG TPA: alanine racemase [Acidimicrobiales bacterium]|jgi:alanine racemase|nr:alanine racemase [Acidimicrobiales bacterium]
MRPTWVTIDPDAIARNVERLAEVVAPASVCAVVKADGYGHGAVPVARAAQRGGASWLAVALVEEGVALREAEVDGPILLLSEPRPGEMPEAHAADLRPTLYSPVGIAAAADAAAHGTVPWRVQLKVDTGMHRIGAAPDEAVALAERIASEPMLELEAVWTHCAVADEPEDPFTATQLDRFDATVDALRQAGFGRLLRHAGNSAVGLAHPRGHYDLVRFGIALYGIAPSPQLDGAVALQPALTLRSEVTHVQTVATGEGVSYGRRWRAPAPTRVATVPIGYADGVRRSLPECGGEVIVRGQRRPMVGVVTMDQLMIDCGDLAVEIGDEVVLIGERDGLRITAEEIAARLGTIGYEVVCAIGARVPRRVKRR